MSTWRLKALRALLVQHGCDPQGADRLYGEGVSLKELRDALESKPRPYVPCGEDFDYEGALLAREEENDYR